MGVREHVEGVYDEQTRIFAAHPPLVAMLAGEAEREDYDRLIANIFRTHQNSPRYLALLYALSPPGSEERVAHNMLEEMGLEEEHGESHPELLLALLDGAAMSGIRGELEDLAQEMFRQSVMAPLLFKSWRQLGLAAMAEVFSFEHMLSRLSTPIADGLSRHRGLSEEALVWFRHHSEVDIQHAEEALDTIADYADYYGFSEAEAAGLIDAVMAENVFIKRYFAPLELERSP